MKLKHWLTPFFVSIIGVGGSLYITYSQNENTSEIVSAQLNSAEKIANSDRRVKALEIFSEKITGSVEDKQIAILLLKAIDPELSDKLSGITDPITIKTNIMKFRSSNYEDRKEGSKALHLLYDKYPREITSGLVNLIPNGKISWPVAIGIPQFFDNYVSCEFTKKEIKKLNQIKLSVWYQDSTRNVKLYLDRVLNKCVTID